MLASRAGASGRGITGTLNRHVFDEIEDARRFFDMVCGSANQSPHKKNAISIVDMVRAADSPDALVKAITETWQMANSQNLPKDEKAMYLQAIVEAAVHRQASSGVFEHIFDKCFKNADKRRLGNRELLVLYILKTRSESADMNARVVLSSSTAKEVNALIVAEHMQRELPFGVFKRS